MAADKRGVPRPPSALPLRSQPHRAHVESANATAAVWVLANISRVGRRGPVPVGARFAHRARSTPDRYSMIARAYFELCRAAGRALRSAKYTTARYDDHDQPLVQKRRRVYAPLLVWMSGPLVTLLNTGVRVLPQRDWEERERQLYATLYGTSVRIESHGTLILPRLMGETLAAVLDDPAREESIRKRAIELAVIALAQFHRLGFTHGDAMAENVLID